jgi:tetratricopeptide (TPR) repeat protein
LLLIGLGFGLAGVQLWKAYHLRAARASLARYHNDEARHHLQMCVSVQPNDPEVLLLVARASRRVGAFDVAEEALTRYEDKHGVDDGLTLERMLLRAERGEIELVERCFRARVEAGHPDAPLILEALVRSFIRNYRLKEAEECLDRWFELEPDNTQALLDRGIISEIRQIRSEAADYYRRVVELDPQHDDARMRLARILVELGQASAALPHLNYLQPRFPDDPLVAVQQARCLELLGQQSQAIEVLDQALERFPQSAEARVLRGKLAMQDGQLEQAEEMLRRAVALDPGTYTTRYQLYTCLSQRGKLDEAKEESNRLKLMEEDMRLLEELAGGKMQKTPHDPALHYQVAQIALRSGQVEEAVRWLHNALREDPHYGPAHQTLAMYYKRIGKPMLAAQHREQARAAGVAIGSSPPPPSARPPAAAAHP